MTETQIKTPPNSKESEMMVLGCMLTSINSLNISADALDDSDFYYTEHKIIFQILKSAYKTDKPVDVHLVCEELKSQDKLKAVGGAAYLTTLAQYAGTSAYIEEYTEILIENSKKREAIYLAEKIIKNAEKKNSEELFIEFHEEINRIEKRGLKDKFPIKFLNQFDENFLLVDPPKKPMLLEYVKEKNPTGFLPKGIVAMLVGAGGIGKTHLLAQLAIAVASGTPWLGIFTTTKHCGEGNKGNVFFGLGENQYEDIHRVLYKAAQKLRKCQPDILKEDPVLETSKMIAAFSFCGQNAAFIEDRKPSLYFRQFKMKLIEKAPKNGWSLIILDPVSRLMGVDAETDNGAATQFISLLEELTIDLPGNPTLLFAHHMNKAGARSGGNQDQGSARGSSALTDGVRWQVNLTKEKDNSKETIKLIMTKTNFTVFAQELTLQKEQDGFLINIAPETEKIKKSVF